MTGIGVTRAETTNSVWLLDLALGRYMRLPKAEQPRPAPQHLVLDDGRWQPMSHCEIDWERRTLHITTPSSAHRIRATLTGQPPVGDNPRLLVPGNQ